MRLLPCDDNLSLRGETLQEALDQDRKEGLIPFYVSLDFFRLVIIYAFHKLAMHALQIHSQSTMHRIATYSERKRHNFRGLVSTIAF